MTHTRRTAPQAEQVRDSDFRSIFSDFEISNPIETAGDFQLIIPNLRDHLNRQGVSVAFFPETIHKFFYPKRLQNDKGDNMTLQKRLTNFLKDLPVNISELCRRLQISRTTLYAFLGGDLELSEATRQRISQFLSSWGH